MLTRIQILKILTSISFLFVIVSNEKFSLIMGLFLLLLFIAGGINGVLYSIIFLGASLYLFVSGLTRPDNKRDDILSLLSIAALYIPIALALGSSFQNSDFWVYFTHAVFLFISILTFIQILIKVIKKNSR